MFENLNLAGYSESLLSFLANYGPQFIAALLVLFIGLWLIGRVSQFTHRILIARLQDDTLANFLSSAADIALKAMLLISVASMVGIQTTSFIAIVGAAGLAIGMALQGSLGNLAGGVMLLIFRPIRVGDYIGAQGHEGTVKDIGIFVTRLETFDKRHIILPNGPLSNGDLVNYTSSDERAVEVNFGISYADDMKLARNALTELMNGDARVIKGHASNLVAVSELGDSSVNILFRAFVKTEDYWNYFFDIHENGKLALEGVGCSIPFPQRDVHLFQSS